MALIDIHACLLLPNDIATSGQPTVEQFAEIKAAGYDVVVNLAMETSSNWLPHEAEIVAEQAMDYVALPVVWDYPCLGDAEQFFEILKGRGDRKLWIHCACNMRVSAMMYLYHRIYQSRSETEAKSYLNKIWTPNAVWQNFMDAVIELYGE